MNAQLHWSASGLLMALILHGPPVSAQSWVIKETPSPIRTYVCNDGSTTAWVAVATDASRALLDSRHFEVSGWYDVRAGRCRVVTEYRYGRWHGGLRTQLFHFYWVGTNGAAVSLPWSARVVFEDPTSFFGFFGVLGEGSGADLHETARTFCTRHDEGFSYDAVWDVACRAPSEPTPFFLALVPTLKTFQLSDLGQGEYRLHIRPNE